MATSSRHIYRRGVLATLSAGVQALLCPCDDCFEVRINGELDRAERDRVNCHLHPLCAFCGSPMIWRGVCFVCPYAEDADLHGEIRDLNLPFKSSLRRLAS